MSIVFNLTSWHKTWAPLTNNMYNQKSNRLAKMLGFTSPRASTRFWKSLMEMWMLPGRISCWSRNCVSGWRTGMIWIWNSRSGLWFWELGTLERGFRSVILGPYVLPVLVSSFVLWHLCLLGILAFWVGIRGLLLTWLGFCSTEEGYHGRIEEFGGLGRRKWRSRIQSNSNCSYTAFFHAGSGSHLNWTILGL